jgi:hypothetical protein
MCVSFFIMDKVTKMDEEVKISAIKGTTFGIHAFLSLWIMVLLVFAFTIKPDPSTVYVCVGTQTIVLTVSFMSSIAAILAKPILVFLYGGDDLFDFRPKSTDRNSQRYDYDENPFYAQSEVDDTAVRPSPIRLTLGSAPRNSQASAPRHSQASVGRPSQSPKQSPRASPMPSPRRPDVVPPLPVPSSASDAVPALTHPPSMNSAPSSPSSTSTPTTTSAAATGGALPAQDIYPAPEHHFEDVEGEDDLSSADGDNAVQQVQDDDDVILDSDDDDTVG